MFRAEQRVTWVRESWYGTYRIPAIVVKVNLKTVRIEAHRRDGTTSLHNVKPENLVIRG